MKNPDKKKVMRGNRVDDIREPFWTQFIAGKITKEQAIGLTTREALNGYKSKR